MCWNAEISLMFGFAMFISAGILKYVGYSGWKRASVALSIYGIMQFAQWINWLTVLPLSDYYGAVNASSNTNSTNLTGNTTNSCTVANRYATYGAFLALQLQVVLNVVASAIGEPADRQTLFRFPIIAACITFVASMFQLIAGELGYRSQSISVNGIFTVFDEAVTCTYVGPGGYLLWRFKLFMHPFLPNFFFVYNLFGLSLFFISNKRQMLACFLGFYGLAAFADSAYPDSAEFAAYWCRSTVGLPIFFGLDCLYEKFFATKTEVAGMN